MELRVGDIDRLVSNEDDRVLMIEDGEPPEPMADVIWTTGYSQDTGPSTSSAHAFRIHPYLLYSSRSINTRPEPTSIVRSLIGSLIDAIPFALIVCRTIIGLMDRFLPFISYLYLSVFC